MSAAIVLGLAAILRRDIRGHRRWISRGYAIGLGAATQMLVLMVVGIIVGPPNELEHDGAMALSWLINLAVAEWAMRKRHAPRGRTTKPSTARVSAWLSAEHT